MSTEMLDQDQAYEAIEFRERIIAKNKEIVKLRFVMDDKQEKAKAAKKAWENANQELNDIISEMSEEYPLFNQAGKKEPEDTPVWGLTLVGCIDCLAPYEEALHNLEIIDAEGFLAFLEEGHSLTEIEGVDEKKAETLLICWRDWLKEAEQAERIANESWRGLSAGNLMNYGVKESIVNKLQDAGLPLLDDVDQCEDLTAFDGIAGKTAKSIKEALETIAEEYKEPEVV